MVGGRLPGTQLIFVLSGLLERVHSFTHKLKTSKAWRGFKKNPLTHPGSTLKTEPGRPKRLVRTSPTCLISKVNGERLK